MLTGKDPEAVAETRFRMRRHPKQFAEPSGGFSRPPGRCALLRLSYQACSKGRRWSGARSPIARQTLLKLQDRGLLELHDLRDLGLISALLHAHRAVRRGVAAQQRRRA